VSTKVVDVSKEHLAQASLCLSYLSLPVFEQGRTDDELTTAIRSGAYAFCDYAYESWSRHLILGLQGAVAPNDSMLQRLEEDLEMFLNCHWKVPMEKPKVPKRVVDAVRLISKSDLREKILLSVSFVENMLYAHVEDTTLSECLDLFRTLLRIRLMLESLARGPEYASLAKYYSGRMFKCTRLYCKWFHEGFTSEADRTAHNDKHERSHHCPHSGCPVATWGCTTKADLDKHISQHHAQDPLEDEFPDDPDDEELQQAAPTFTCPHCDRNFTRAFNLKVHLRTHETSDKPFACPTCPSRFVRQGDLRRHEQLHANDRKYLCHGVLEDGEEWGCKKSYKRADALARHHQTPAAQAYCLKRPEAREAASLLTKKVAKRKDGVEGAGGSVGSK